MKISGWQTIFVYFHLINLLIFVCILCVIIYSTSCIYLSWKEINLDKRVLKFVGDATHDQATHEFLIMCGFATKHHDPIKKKWSTIVLSSMYVICSNETIDIVQATLAALVDVMRKKYKIELLDYIEDLYFDGHPVSPHVFSKTLSNYLGHI